jgi:pyridoxine 5-phosphate synthase
MVTLVPERREELTTEGGLDVVGGRDSLRKIVKTLRDAEIVVSLFIDPDLDQVKASHRAEAQVVEFHTGRFCDAQLVPDRNKEHARLVDACKAARKLGLVVAAGHGLHYGNVHEVAGIEEVEELNIGHSIVSRAVLVGLERAVREMKELIAGSRR